MNDRWIMDIHSTAQQVWMVWIDCLEKVQLMRTTKLYTARVCLAFRSGSTAMGDGKYASKFDMSKLWNGLICFPDFKIIHIPRAKNQIVDSLARTQRSFNRELCFIGCSILVRFSDHLKFD
ncbi:hypothetical protein IGI04_029697 [Brassica rapa subsp. trilocularis]|uniref:RNase H type-1 domain-containing protein n=1 Tax=Brassica rapa subsp. trilocularis TaxID=1813537 RepID=A0ABQ7LNK2_BRACM|nr:hypothetical protein IGI04_029697 [Brassica rapa subsp. trilocularis]